MKIRKSSTRKEKVLMRVKYREEKKGINMVAKGMTIGFCNKYMN